jgi:hypothetical protein
LVSTIKVSVTATPSLPMVTAVAVPNWPLASMTTGKPPLTVPRIPAMKVWFWPFVPSNGKPIRIVFVSEDEPYREIPVHYGIEEFREDLLTIDALERR